MCAALLSCSGGAGSAYEKYSISTDAGLDSALLSLKTNPSDYLLGDAILRYCTEKGYFDVIIDGFPSVFRHAEAEGDGRMALNCGLYLSQGDTLNMGVMLMNITTIYLTRRDTSGLPIMRRPRVFPCVILSL